MSVRVDCFRYEDLQKLNSTLPSFQYCFNIHVFAWDICSNERCATSQLTLPPGSAAKLASGASALVWSGVLICIVQLSVALVLSTFLSLGIIFESLDSKMNKQSGYVRCLVFDVVCTVLAIFLNITVMLCFLCQDQPATGLYLNRSTTSFARQVAVLHRLVHSRA